MYFILYFNFTVVNVLTLLFLFFTYYISYWGKVSKYLWVNKLNVNFKMKKEKVSQTYFKVEPWAIFRDQTFLTLTCKQLPSTQNTLATTY